jgi:hypothetical protein
MLICISPNTQYSRFAAVLMLFLGRLVLMCNISFSVKSPMRRKLGPRLLHVSSASTISCRMLIHSSHKQLVDGENATNLHACTYYNSTRMTLFCWDVFVWAICLCICIAVCLCWGRVLTPRPVTLIECVWWEDLRTHVWCGQDETRGFSLYNDRTH